MSAQPANPAAGQIGASVGQRLKRERERKGLSIKQAADSMHLDTWAIEALEEERFTALGPPVYVKGHLHKYAALLELDTASLVSLYETQQESGPALAPLGLRLSMRMVRPRRWKPVVLVAILVVALIAAAVYWLALR